MMPADRRIAIRCTACGRESLLVREPCYEGLRKTGERLACAACGVEYPDEGSVPFKDDATPTLFHAGDRDPQVKLFESGEADRLCRHCAHYVVNPFMQWCAQRNREIEATDHCDAFARKNPPPREPPPHGAP